MLTDLALTAAPPRRVTSGRRIYAQLFLAVLSYIGSSTDALAAPACASLTVSATIVEPPQAPLESLELLNLQEFLAMLAPASHQGVSGTEDESAKYVVKSVMY